ncbi:penicillin-binding transpeptidase domain-containing protein [Yinghuangia seranimata]|uniref:penicillin-binding transpeptidase domain-containing protein n=1 Tax=Yinghuangia seranimata TaxID=408067 RepID=UPI00248C77FF|nr:penicillin-binding transpeptidase domain-containing protein [Yinghuangia seranimata]MDI2125931.1 penicillin-binding transpeptidase domain-containing protein [Yinghuangia seranimata]
MPKPTTTQRAKRISVTALSSVLLAAAVSGCGLFGGDDDGAKNTSAESQSPTAAVAPPAAPATSAPPVTSAPPSSAAPSPSATTPDTGPGSSTIVDALQNAAVTAVGNDGSASLVALNMKNGEIVATVHRQNGMSGNLAPGSTFKIVTSALLLSKGAVTPGTKAPCAKTLTVNGQAFKNVHDMELSNATFREDFAKSCNNGLIAFYDKIGDKELSEFSTKYFGLNSNAWKVGADAGTTDGVVPPASSLNDRAAQMIGQSSLKMNPMTMASVVATAVTGQFHQPVLKRGQDVYTVSSKLPASVSRDLKTMMVDCATGGGTGAEVLRGMSNVGCKTGTAEVGTTSTNAWMVAYRGDIAVAVLVEGGTSGSGAAGPIIKQFLAAVPS